MRRHEAWNQDSNKILYTFIDQLISSNTQYDYTGALRLGLSLVSDKEISRKIQRLLDSSTNNQSTNKSMFCSQLVASCFIIIGFIGDSAKHLFNPTETPPSKLAEDRVYGNFLGYIWSDANHCIPEDDELFHNMY